jgi:hypothetical protein
VVVFLLIRWEQFSCGAEMQRALIFWPLRLLVLHAMATLLPVCLCAVEDERYGRPDLRRERVRWYSARYPIVIEVWMPSWWNEWGHVGSWRGSGALVDCVRPRLSHQREWVPWLGAPRAPRLAIGLHASLRRGGSMPRGYGDLMTSQWLGRGREMLGWDEVCRSCRKRPACCQRLWRVNFTEAPMMGL